MVLVDCQRLTNTNPPSRLAAACGRVEPQIRGELVMDDTSQQPLLGKVAMITGASRRIGASTALALAAAGADLVLNARSSRHEVDGVAEEVRQKGRRALVAMADVTREDEVGRMVDDAGTEFGRIDILINNAAIRKQAPFTDMTYDEWRQILAVILDGAFLCCRAVLPVMVAGGGGTIINIGGLTAHIGAAKRAHVCAAKAGLVGLTKALAVEFAEQGVTVNCVVPGKIGGERSQSSGVSPIGADRIPLGREGDVAEVSGMIAAMCMPAARFMTGQSVHVSGGLYMP
jgi:3-oxoacyl-[acyl-carrier protein] reductase